MARVTQRGISAAQFFAGPTTFHTGNIGVTAATEGTDTTPVVTEEYVAFVFVPMNTKITGLALLNGSAVAGNVRGILYDSNGAIVASTASTAQAGIAAYQNIPLSAATDVLGPAMYFIGFRFDNVAARFRSHTIGTFGASKKTGQTYATLTALTPPTSFTASVGPIADTY